MKCHVVEQFNSSHDLLIASDDYSSKKTKKSTNSEAEGGVSRGIDFRNVSNVINFDFPPEINSYIHRAGRTARGNNKGSVLSFVSLKEKDAMDLVEEHLEASYNIDDAAVIKKHMFKMDDIEPFRYRAKDAWFAVTKTAIKEARVKEIKREIKNSEKMKTFLENKPKEQQLIQHDVPLNIIKPQHHLAEIPDYIVPKALKNIVGIERKRKRTDTKTFVKSNPKAKDALAFERIDYSKKRKRF
jgi:ATP-dependent RNA helicase DDX56/DBP9